MDRIFHHDDTMYEAATKVYAKVDDVYAYADSDCTVKISADNLADIFIRGMIVVDDGVMYKPTSCEVDSGVATITYAKANSTTVELATLESE